MYKIGKFLVWQPWLKSCMQKKKKKKNHDLYENALDLMHVIIIHKANTHTHTHTHTHK